MTGLDKPSKAFDPASLPAFDIMAVPGLDIVSDAVDYWVDSAQRWLLFWDCLRRSGNAFLADAPEPEGETDPEDRAWTTHGLQIRPVPADDGVVTDPAKRPVLVFDPRAGTEAGDATLNETVRRALYAGHAVYQAVLEIEAADSEPDPQALEAAETAALALVAGLHGQAEAGPVRIGRCSDLPRIAALVLLDSDGVGADLVDAVPSSYWCGTEWAGPFRWLGALAGGQWLASFDRDLCGGRQDGSARAAAPFWTDTAARLWEEPAALYQDVDAAAPAYLARAWRRDRRYRKRTENGRFHVGGPGLAGMDAPEGTLLLDDGAAVDLRAAPGPVLLHASDFGRDDATRALGTQIRRAFGSVEQIVTAGRVVVYCRDRVTGQVSALIMPAAQGAHARALQNDLLRLCDLPPGLYEMAAEAVPHPDAAGTPITEDVRASLVPRGFDDDALFADTAPAADPLQDRAADWSASLDWFYKMTVRPWVRLWPTKTAAATTRALYPARAWRTICSDANPAMAAVKGLAGLVREDRRPAAVDNDFVAAERSLARQFSVILRSLCTQRDEAMRAFYGLVFGNPLWPLLGR